MGDITQQRNGFTIDVTITIRRLTTGACIAIAPQVSRNIRLNGSFAESGAYTVRVNGVEKTVHPLAGSAAPRLVRVTNGDAPSDAARSHERTVDASTKW